MDNLHYQLFNCAFSTISFKDSNEYCTNVYPDWYSLMDVLQGINMKNLSPKTLLCLLLASLLFCTKALSVEPNEIVNEIAVQQNVHLNKSTVEDLITLKGVGYKKAQAIVVYRTQIGEFKSVRELTNVKGIGEKILTDNKDRLKI